MQGELGLEPKEEGGSLLHLGQDVVPGCFHSPDGSLMKIMWPANIHRENSEGEQLSLPGAPAVKICAHNFISISFCASELNGYCRRDKAR